MSCRRCNERGQTWNGSASRCAFDNEQEFSGEGWNCATANAIRGLFPSSWSDEGHLAFSFSRRYDDECEASISVAHVVLETGRAKTLWVGWYKGRGRTDEMWLLGDGPPRQPSLGDCEAILAAFERQ